MCVANSQDRILYLYEYLWFQLLVVSKNKNNNNCCRDNLHNTTYSANSEQTQKSKLV